MFLLNLASIHTGRDRALRVARRRLHDGEQHPVLPRPLLHVEDQHQGPHLTAPGRLNFLMSAVKLAVMQIYTFDWRRGFATLIRESLSFSEVLSIKDPVQAAGTLKMLTKYIFRPHVSDCT